MCSKRKKQNVVLVVLLVLALPSFSQRRGNLSFGLSPSLEVPLGASATFFSLAPGGAITAALLLPGLEWLDLSARLGYAYLPSRVTETASIAEAALGIGAAIPAGRQFSVGARATAGYYYSFVNLSATPVGGGGLFAEGVATASFRLNDFFSICIDGGYTQRFGLSGGLRASLGASYTLPRRAASSGAGEGRVRPKGLGIIIEPPRIQFSPVYPVALKYYDEHPVGTILLKNKSSSPLEGVEIELLVRQFMDAPRRMALDRPLAPGRETEVLLFCVFNEKALEVTEATKTTAEVSISYRWRDAEYRDELTETMRVMDRNAMTWEDNRRVAAFVTAKDPAILGFAKQSVAVAGTMPPSAIDPGLARCVALFNAVRLFGVTYSSDPAGPYVKRSASGSAVDYLQFPRQTLEYKGGDCDDLSILLAALLESVGIESAFITVPGHIYIAAAAVAAAPVATALTIQQDGRFWFPIEVTAVAGGAVSALRLGLEEWRACDAEARRLYPTHDAWVEYQPVWFPGADRTFSTPGAELVQQAFAADMTAIGRELAAPGIARIRADITSGGDTAARRNALAVEFARFGLLSEAKVQLDAILAKESFPPALINRANIDFLLGAHEEAAQRYERAIAATARKGDTPPNALLMLSKCYYALGRYKEAAQAFARLEAASPQMAAANRYLATGTDSDARAQGAGDLGGASWTE